jgi:acetate kinase
MATGTHSKSIVRSPAGAVNMDNSGAVNNSCILALNAGSSSIRFGLFDTSDHPQSRLRGKLDMFGISGPNLNIDGAIDQPAEHILSDIADSQSSSALRLLDRLEALPEFPCVKAVGHRVVHGMQHSVPELVTPELIAAMRRNVPFDPQHLPLEIELMEAIAKRRPALPQVACFDTAFHRTMPRVASILPIPRRYEAAGVRRYGFHGLSYEFLMQELARLDVPTATTGRLILAHLGNGASLAAVRDGHCIDTSMGFTPASGLVMGTRSGDLDPGVISYLARVDKLSVSEFETMTNDASGLLGISEISADMRKLLAHEATDVRAAEAVALFCYQTRKWIGSFAAALGGLDTLVFSGGIGENLPEIRRRICEDLTFLGVTLNEARNAANANYISIDDARVGVHVVRTDEELVIAQSVVRTIATLQLGIEANQKDPLKSDRRAT